LPEEIVHHRNGIGNRLAVGGKECHQVLENMRRKKKYNINAEAQ